MLHTSNSFTVNYPLEEADVVFLGVPFDSTAYSEGNQRYGPVTIREALKYRGTYQEDLGVNPLKDLKIHDAGDLEVVPGDYLETEKMLMETIGDIREVNEDAFLTLMGGEHSISLGMVKSLEPATVVQLDAHRDMDEDLNGNEYTHNTWAGKAEDEADILQIGTRNYTGEEEAEIGVKGEEDLDSISEPIYLSIDIDALDPRYAPDVGYPEPNGMSPEEVDEILGRVFEKEVVGMDLCEVASKELNNRTSYLAGWIILRALARI